MVAFQTRTIFVSIIEVFKQILFCLSTSSLSGEIMFIQTVFLTFWKLKHVCVFKRLLVIFAQNLKVSTSMCACWKLLEACL